MKQTRTQRAQSRAKKALTKNKPKTYVGARSSQRFTKYGIVKVQFDEMLAAQNNSCAICSKPLIKPAIDHDHNTGFIRGILCFNCNVGLGMFGDSITNLVAAIEYLSK